MPCPIGVLELRIDDFGWVNEQTSNGLDVEATLFDAWFEYGKYRNRLSCLGIFCADDRDTIVDAYEPLFDQLEQGNFFGGDVSETHI